MSEELIEQLRTAISKAEEAFDEASVVIDIMTKAGEDVTEIKRRQAKLKRRIEKWKAALPD